MNTQTVFYDGYCALCHGLVLFILRHDHAGKFTFAPLQGETFKQHVPPTAHEPFPDSVVLLNQDGSFSLRSSAIVKILTHLGGVWRPLGWLLWIIPRPVRDVGYDLVARFRRKIFGSKTELCPIVPQELRGRFL